MSMGQEGRSVSRVTEHGVGAGTNIRTPFRSDITPCFFLIETLISVASTEIDNFICGEFTVGSQ